MRLVREIYLRIPKYRATIVFCRKQYALEEYNSLNDAARARKAAEDRFFRGLLGEND